MKKRMGNKSGDGLLAVQAMVRTSLERLWRDPAEVPTLADILVDLLTDGDKLTRASRQRVEHLLHLLQRQTGYKSQFIVSIRSGTGDTLADLYFSSYYNISMELNQFLRDYRIIPQFDLAEDGPMLFFLTSGLEDDSDPERQHETAAVMCALQLAERGQIDKVRKCFCGNFFVPRRIDMNHCTTKCRVKEHQSSEEFKVHRRAMDRKRYRDIQDGKVKQTTRRKRGT